MPQWALIVTIVAYALIIVPMLGLWWLDHRGAGLRRWLLALTTASTVLGVLLVIGLWAVGLLPPEAVGLPLIILNVIGFVFSRVSRRRST